MDDTPTNEEPKKEFNQLDLTQLQSFSFGTQWTQDKADPSGRSRERDDRPRREGGGPPDAKRDRRVFRRPLGAPPPGGAPGGGGEGGEGRGDRRSGPGGPGSQHQGGPGGAYAGGPRDAAGRPPYRGPRREGPGGGGGGGYGGGGYGRGPQERGPYISPYYTTTFYPEDTSFTALAKTIRASCRTFELFDIAKTVIGKNDRFVVVVQRKTAEEGGPAPATPPAEGAPARQPLYVALADGLPFETEEAAVNHVLTNHLDRFFEAAEAEVEPPKGNFQVINRCSVTGELLGPPNYHRYTQIVQQHHANRLPRMPFDVFRSRIESVRDPEAVNQWLEKMKKITRYTWKLDRPVAPGAPAETAATPAEPAAEPAPDAPAAEAPAEEGAATEAAPAAPAAPSFDSLADARVYLLTQARDKVVRAVDHARFHGRGLETMPDGEIRRAIEGALERQRRFPLDTANALRGRLRREGFTIFKKGSKGVSYVCAVKRKFRVPGQTFADSIGQLITYVEAHPMVKASELPQKFLGLTAPAAPTAGAAAPEAALSIEDQQRVSRLQGDLRWLVTEGYVTEFIDGSLFAPPPMVEARKRELEAGEGDMENFPDAPAPARPAAAATPAAPATAPADTAPADENAPAPDATTEEASPAETVADTAPDAAEPAETEAGEPSPEAQPAPAEAPEATAAEPEPAPVPAPEPEAAPTEPAADGEERRT
jgi:hypothetical protein